MPTAAAVAAAAATAKIQAMDAVATNAVLGIDNFSFLYYKITGLLCVARICLRYFVILMNADTTM